MVRAAVLIGVSQAGNLQTLKAVHEGVRAMQRWAAGLGMDPDLIRVFSDKDGPVDNHHGISGYLDHKVVAKRIHDALVEPARGFCGVLTG